MDYLARKKTRFWKTREERTTQDWSTLIVMQGEDGFGATVLLGRLFAASQAILKKLVNDKLLEAFQALIKKCGPQPRLINLFASICFVEGAPVRVFQEACCRKLWMNVPDRYKYVKVTNKRTNESLPLHSTRL